MKGVILAGGTGSRLYPLTRITNKHLLPIYDRPMIAWSIEAVVSSGIDEIMLVTGGTHAGEFLRLLGNGREYGINQLSYAYQEKAGGIAEALGLAAHFAEGGAGARHAGRQHRRAVDPAHGRRLLRRSGRGAHSAVQGGRARAPAPPRRAVFGADGRVTHIDEKPEQPASDYCVTGIYCYEAGVFDIIGDLVPSGRGELEITDVNNHYVGKGQMAHDVQEGFWGDAGESIEAYYAVNDFVRQNGANSAYQRTAPAGRLSRGAGSTGTPIRARRMVSAMPVPSSPRLARMSSALPCARYCRGTPRIRGARDGAARRLRRVPPWRRGGRRRHHRGGRRPPP